MAEYFETSTKLRSLFTSPQLLYEEFNNQLPNFRRHKRDGYVRNDFIINILPHAAEDSASSHVATSTGTHPFLPPVENREKQEAEFMYSQFLRDILISIDDSPSSVEEM
ncbi:unnamed protein product, partial [Rotaria sp. Silwood2]